MQQFYAKKIAGATKFSANGGGGRRRLLQTWIRAVLPELSGNWQVTIYEVINHPTQESVY